MCFVYMFKSIMIKTVIAFIFWWCGFVDPLSLAREYRAKQKWGKAQTAWCWWPGHPLIRNTVASVMWNACTNLSCYKLVACTRDDWGLINTLILSADVLLGMRSKNQIQRGKCPLQLESHGLFKLSSFRKCR